jgi:hypothetical protein
LYTASIGGDSVIPASKSLGIAGSERLAVIICGEKLTETKAQLADLRQEQEEQEGLLKSYERRIDSLDTENE